MESSSSIGERTAPDDQPDSLESEEDTATFLSDGDEEESPDLLRMKEPTKSDSAEAFPAPHIAEKLASLPHSPGCYFYYNRRGELLYIGKAISLRNRVRSYFHKDRDRAPKIRRLVKQIADIEWREVPTELHALTLECRLIKENQPRFNAMLKNDRRLPYLRLSTEEAFPLATLDYSREPGEGRRFGPFAHKESLDGLLDVLNRVFMIRTEKCPHDFAGSERKRPCLYYDLGQCLAPCNRKFCSREEYREAVDNAIEFLEGQGAALAERLESEMMEAAEALRFEKAARLRNMREAVLHWMEHQNFIALWEEAATRTCHFFFIHGARLEGYRALRAEEIAEDAPTWRLAVLKTLRDTYASRKESLELLGTALVEELNIAESWLNRKGARKAFVAPPAGPDDFPALERMMSLIEGWMHPGVESASSDEVKPLSA